MSANEIQSKARKRKELKTMKEETEAEISAIDDALKAAMGEKEELLIGKYKLACRTISTYRRFCMR